MLEMASLPCIELPPLVDVDITVAQDEKVARRIQGSARPGGNMALQWQSFLLIYGEHSKQLRDVIVELARCLST